MDEYPDYIFAASQAQQYEWLKENYPELFDRLRKHPRFVPTGGTWVEMDCNIPSGEALVRQFLYGQRFFEKEMGGRCTEFWLPDTFGYCSQLPQIIKGSGMDYFLTQKLSWNLINKFPHNTFTWQGLDGSKVLCHFPPADTYCSSCSVKDVVYTVTNHKNKLTSNKSMLLFGFGDGGGGPTRPLLERLSRMENTDQLPVVKFEKPVDFFKGVEAEGSHPVWVGELYFELHNGTYTTQALCKYYNRTCEFLLSNIEMFSILALAKKGINTEGFSYPKAELDRLWKLVLLNQFHDVIPGTSIGAVYVDAHRFYVDVTQSGTKLLSLATSTINPPSQEEQVGLAVFNPLGWERRSVCLLPAGVRGLQKAHSEDGKELELGIVDAPSLGWKTCDTSSSKIDQPAVVRTDASSGHVILENELVRAEFSKYVSSYFVT